MLKIIAIMLILATAAVAHIVRLDDGSRLVGRVLTLDERSLVLSTDYAGTLTLERDRVAAILFDESLSLPGRGAPASEEAVREGRAGAPEGSGFLELIITGDPAKSSVRFRQESERESMLALNTLHLRLYVDGEEAAHAEDARMEKQYRQGNWLVLRNSHRFEPLRVELPAGSHRLQVVVSNDIGSAPDAGDQDVLSAEIVVDDVDIVPGQLTRVILKGKSGRLGSYGHYALELLSSR